MQTPIFWLKQIYSQIFENSWLDVIKQSFMYFYRAKEPVLKEQADRKAVDPP